MARGAALALYEAAHRLEVAANGWVLLLATATVALALFVWPAGYLLVIAVVGVGLALMWLGHTIASLLVVATRDRGRALERTEP